FLYRCTRYANASNNFGPHSRAPRGVGGGGVGVLSWICKAAGRPAAAIRSHGLDLLRWLRFLWAIEMAWDQVTPVEPIQVSAGPTVLAPERSTHPYCQSPRL